MFKIFGFFVNTFNKFCNYLSNNNCECFNKIHENDKFDCSDKVVSYEDILNKKKTKIDDENDGNPYRDKVKENKKAFTKLSTRSRFSYAVYIKNQNIIKSLKNGISSIGKLFSKKKKKDKIKDYELELEKFHARVTIMMLQKKILRSAEKRFGKLNMSVYLGENMDLFLNRVKHGINKKKNQQFQIFR